MDKINPFNYHYIIIVLFSLAVHGLLLLNDGVYWDGWLVYTILIEKQWDSLYLIFTQTGGPPITLYLHWLLGYFPGIVFGYKLVAFGALTTSGILVYLISNELKLLSRLDSLFIVLLSLSYPAFQVAIELINIPSIVYYCLFLLACFLALQSEKRSGVVHYLLRVCSLGIFVISFTVNSLLLFYFGFLLIWFVGVQSLLRLPPRQILFSFLPRRLDFLFLPFLYWGLHKSLFPVRGLYANYNQFRFSLPSLIANLTKFVNNAIYGQFRYTVGAIALWLLALGILFWGYSIFKRKSGQSLRNRDKAYTLFIFGFFLLMLGMLPYILVGKSPSLHGWDTRHALLVGLPMAVIIVAITHLAFPGPSDSFSKLGFLFLGVILLAFSVSTITNYISWQARWVKDRSIIVNLGQLDNVEDISVFWVDDQFPTRGGDSYRFYEWSSIFKRVWGDETRIGLDQKTRSPEFLIDGQRYFNDRYNLLNFDPAGCQAILMIRRGLPYTDDQLFSRYLFSRFFEPSKMNEFLAEITDIQVQSIFAPEAVNCQVD
ncbi:MAG: hypothetical protein GY797_18870 [Deltaproteobacteria bacterium]|nr:hypothetical protein [Deltaproteobacteria bacterium]